ncbi:hypothetical protein BIFGAL_03368 [Bifidobacterium gallicum DSM 20093 = LMG 11596]|uniref:Uncharacterized protein n=1 Tax=Bifidobacterium gallicum DSM 20093 = LMG 11596 TaxID=561180 RepID=D1NU47_9BIFI|nr:hypothetical protein BIFGAL_03368 [Bifidobacterium gallicum DSM 20093 = LMG 11596]
MSIRHGCCGRWLALFVCDEGHALRSQKSKTYASGFAYTTHQVRLPIFRGTGPGIFNQHTCKRVAVAAQRSASHLGTSASTPHQR